MQNAPMCIPTVLFTQRISKKSVKYSQIIQRKMTERNFSYLNHKWKQRTFSPGHKGDTRAQSERRQESPSGCFFLSFFFNAILYKIARIVIGLIRWECSLLVFAGNRKIKPKNALMNPKTICQVLFTVLNSTHPTLHVSWLSPFLKLTKSVKELQRRMVMKAVLGNSGFFKK